MGSPSLCHKNWEYQVTWIQGESRNQWISATFCIHCVHFSGNIYAVWNYFPDYICIAWKTFVLFGRVFLMSFLLVEIHSLIVFQMFSVMFMLVFMLCNRNFLLIFTLVGLLLLTVFEFSEMIILITVTSFAIMFMVAFTLLFMI